MKSLAYGIVGLAAFAAPFAAQAGSASLYVQDGLIACWDGIENAGAGIHDPAAAVWKDLVAGREFALTGVTVNDDRMTFAGSATSFGNLSAADTTSTFVAAKNGTMEIVYASPTIVSGQNYQILLQSTASAGLAFGLYNSSSIIAYTTSTTTGKPVLSFTSGTATNSVSVRYSSCVPASAIANGETQSFLSRNDYWGSPDASGTTFIGVRASKANNTHFPGSIYCIRLYNRQLTDEEIVANHAIDNMRFRDGSYPDDELVVFGAPGNYGSPYPAYGDQAGLEPGDTIVASCESYTNSEQMIEYLCTGWKLYDKNGNVVSNGTDKTFTYTHPTPAAFRMLQWQWSVRKMSSITDATLPVGGAAFHVDASMPSTLTTVESGGKKIVTAWCDADGGLMKATAGSSSRPWLVTDDGFPYVDFGPQTKGNGTAAGDTAGHLTWSSQLTTIREVFLVFSDYPGSAHSFFLGDSSVYHFHRNQKKLFNTTYASAYVQNGLIEVDGVVRDVSYTLPEGFHIIHLRTTGAVTANRFAQDRTEDFGGQRLQEVIVYTKTLTDAEAEATYDYLEGKWFSNPGVLEVDGSPEQLGSPSPAYGVQVGIAAGAMVPVSCGATIVSNAEETAYGCVGWKLYDKDDNVISSGEGTSFTYEHPTPAEYRRLEWQWVKLLTILPIPDQVNETFDPCRPEFTVFNRVNGATYTVGGTIASPYFDVEYTGNDAVGTANVVAIGKGEFAGLSANGNFNITATKREDENIYTTDVTARRREVAGKYVYVFTNAAAAQVSMVKRNLAMTDYLVVGGGGGGGNAMGGGGGGGGVTNATGIVRALLSAGDTFTVSVGAGGAVSGAGAAGASGGGGSVSGAGGAGIDGIGYAGATVANSRTGGGGGGAGHEGYPYTDSPARAGNGGEGIVSSITGEAVYYGGGGGGGADNCDPGFGGLGGGGDGKKKAAGQPGTDGFGGGGGGGSWLGSNSDSRNCGGNGGSGTVILALRPGDFNIEPIADQYLDVGAGGGCTPEPVVRTSDGVTLLTKDVDYTVSYTGNTQSGTGFLTVTGINGQSGKVCEISFKIYLRYFVDSEAGPGGDGSAASPFATISNAVEKAKTDIGGGALLVEIDVAVGTYIETGFVLDAPIVIVGANRDTVEIVDNVAGYRAFTISHADAAVRNLTISGGGLKTNNGQGGHIRMTAGLVENCVIKNGRAGASKGYGYGGNVWMSGGRLERCLVTGGLANWGGFSATEACGMGLYATGGTIDSCWFKDHKTDNSDGNNSASVYLNGAATMVNCTVTGGWARNYKGKGSGIHIANASAKVVNCVAYGNYVGKGTISNTAVSNFGSGNFDRYFYCGSSFTNTSCATWTVLTDEDFVNYVTFTGTAEADLKTYFNSAAYASFDWHQRLSSAIVDGGTMDTAYRPEDSATLDLDGSNRVSGVSIDLGCWERDQSQFECAGRLASYGALETANVTFIAKVFGPSSDVVIRWDYGNGVTNDTSEATHVYAYPAAGYFTVKLSASPDGGSTWTDWYTVPTRLAVAPARMYVDSNCATPVFPYKTRETAATTLGAVVGSLTNNVSENKTIVDGVDIVILKGSKSNDTGCFLATAVTVRGETGNPADAEIVDNVAGSRAFTLTHPDAVVSNLTISGLGFRTTGSPSGGGGHVWMSAGLVANCIIKNGRASGQKGTAHGGNVYMTGGRIERCLVTGGMANWGGYNNESLGMGLYATGGTIDSCFFKDNKDDTSDDGHSDGSVCLNGAVTMVNCTVTGGLSRDYSGHGTGIYIKNANAKVVNCVAYGNYSYFRGTNSYATNSLASNCGNANLGRYFYCGAAFTNTSCATWTVLTDADFVKYSSCTGRTYTAIKTYLASEDYSKFDWHQKRDSKIVNSGTLDTAYRPADSVTRDLDGNERVLNRTIDLGCWEKMLSVGFFYILR